MRIILASQSPRRKKLLQQIGLDFDVVPSTIEEYSEKTHPSDFVVDLALQKAQHVAKKAPGSLIIGSDTIVVLGNEILGKPSDKEEASAMLNQLSGKTHHVYTGVSLIRTDNFSEIINIIHFSVKTAVTFSRLHQTEINHYIETGNPFDKAGSYGIQDDWGATFVEQIEGDFYNVVGLPINKLYSALKAHFPETLNHMALNT